MMKWLDRLLGRDEVERMKDGRTYYMRRRDAKWWDRLKREADARARAAYGSDDVEKADEFARAMGALPAAPAYVPRKAASEPQEGTPSATGGDIRATAALNSIPRFYALDHASPRGWWFVIDRQNGQPIAQRYTVKSNARRAARRLNAKTV